MRGELPRSDYTYMIQRDTVMNMELVDVNVTDDVSVVEKHETLRREFISQCIEPIYHMIREPNVYRLYEHLLDRQRLVSDVTVHEEIRLALTAVFGDESSAEYLEEIATDILKCVPNSSDADHNQILNLEFLQGRITDFIDILLTLCEQYNDDAPTFGIVSNARWGGVIAKLHLVLLHRCTTKED